MTRRRVVITGLGTVNPLALNVPNYWRGPPRRSERHRAHNALRSDQVQNHERHRHRVQSDVRRRGEGVQSEPTIETRAARRLDRFAQFAIVAAAEAVAESGLDFAKENAFRCGCILGSGIGGIAELEEGHCTLLESAAQQTRAVPHRQDDRRTRASGNISNPVRSSRSEHHCFPLRVPRPRNANRRFAQCDSARASRRDDYRWQRSHDHAAWFWAGSPACRRRCRSETTTRKGRADRSTRAATASC